MTLHEKAQNINKLSPALLAGQDKDTAGEALCFVPAMAALYGAVLKLRPSQPDWADRDRLICTGQVSLAAQLAALADGGFFPVEDLSPSCLDRLMPGLEIAPSGPEAAMSGALASALKARADIKIYRTFLMISQEDCLKGQLWEMAVSASENLLDDLTVVLCRPAGDILPGAGNICAKFSAFGFDTFSVDGDNPDAVAMALLLPRRSHKPLFVCCDVK